MKNYAKITFENCGFDYDYTICEISDINEYVGHAVDLNFIDVDEVGYKEWQSKGYMPEIKISLVQMSEKKFDVWFKEHIESKA